MMSPGQYDEEAIFHAALEKGSPREREAYLQSACRGNTELLGRLQALVEAAGVGNDFLDDPDSEGETSEVSVPSEGPGATIGRYKLLERIGVGGFGVVWAAEQKTPVKRRVALKIIKLGMDTKQVVARFEAERQALALMDHPNIAKVLDGGATDTGRPYFVMELVRGIPIVEYCDQERLSTRARLDLFVQVCHAIQHAHQKGIIHRDIKPSNILITLHDGVPVPRVIDFGVAKATQQELTEKTIYTLHNQFIGTPAYMSPEQAEMSGLDIDTCSDIYSLGVLLYELLTGRTPFEEKELLQSGIDAMRKIIREKEPPKPSTKFATLQMEEQSTTAIRHATDSPRLISLLRGDLDWIVMKCLEKNRTRRYETANGLALDVVRHLNNDPVEARPPTVLYRLQKAWRRNKVVYTAAGLVMLSLVIGTSLSLWQAWVATDARKAAEAAKEGERILRTKAEDGERKQRLIAYEADMKLGREYLKKHDLKKVEELLDRYVPTPGETNLRDIEWEYLRQAIAGDETYTLPHGAEVRDVSVSEDGARLASITLSGKVRLFEVESRKLLQEHGGGNMAYEAKEGSVAISPDGRFLAADQQGVLMVWDADSEVVLLEQPHAAAPIGFSPDSRYLAGVTWAGLCLWNTGDWTTTRMLGTSLPDGTSQVCSLAFTPDRSRVIFASTRFGSKLIVYNLVDDSVEGELTGLDSPHVISTNGSLVAAGGRDGQVCLWDLVSRQTMRKFEAHASIVVGVALSPDGKTLATGGNDSEIRLWDTQTCERIGLLKGHYSQVWDLEFTGDGRYLASASMDRSVKLWDWSAESRRGRSASIAQEPSQESVLRPTGMLRTVDSNDDSAAERTPSIHSVMPGDSIQAAIDAAAAGDQIDIAPGTYRITETIVVNKPLTIGGAIAKDDGESLPTMLKGAEGLLYVIHIDTEVGSATEIRDLQIESSASGIQHLSGNLMLRRCTVIIGSALDFQKAISLEAMGSTDHPTDTVSVDGCALLGRYVGDTPDKHTPPDIDLVLAAPGSRYVEISVTGCSLTNEVPNAISNGIETRSTTAHLTIRDNHIRCLGMGVVIPNHVGAMDICDNTIWSARIGVTTGNKSSDRSNISGNRITVDDQGLQLYPEFVREFIATPPSSCISIGGTSAGVAAAFFNQKNVIGQGANFWVEDNALMGNPKHGISLVDWPEPESYGPPTPNKSHSNFIARNDFSKLKAEWDIALGSSTSNNLVVENIGMESVFKEAGDNDRNTIRTD
jgi:serine/threonine protein kinase/WD40 repeat protein